MRAAWHPSKAGSGRGEGLMRSVSREAYFQTSPVLEGTPHIKGEETSKIGHVLLYNMARY